MFNNVAFRDEQGKTRVGRINISMEKLKEMLNLKDEYEVLTATDDWRKNTIVVMVTGPGLPINYEGEIVESIFLEDIQKESVDG